MAGTAISRSNPGHIGLIEKQTEMEHWHRLFFTRFMGKVKYAEKTGEPMIPNSPIVMMKQYAKDGMDFLKVPMLRHLTQAEFYGDNEMTKKLEGQTIDWATTYINQRRTGVEPPKANQNQRLKFLDLVKRAQGQIEEKMPKNTEIHILSAFYEGFSRNVTATVANYGLGITKRYHPNIFAAGVGEVTWSGTSATHITNIHNAVQTVKGGAAANKMSASLLRKFWYWCDDKLIATMQAYGQEVRPLLISNSQAAQLWEDQEFREALQYSDIRGSKNRLFTGYIGMYHGWIIYNRNLVFGIDTTSSALTFGATNPLSGLDTYSTKVAITFGPRAMTAGWASGPNYTSEKYDHGNVKEVGVNVIDGYACSHFYDDPTTPTTALNQTSALLITESPAEYV